MDMAFCSGGGKIAVVSGSWSSCIQSDFGGGAGAAAGGQLTGLGAHRYSGMVVAKLGGYIVLVKVFCIGGIPPGVMVAHSGNGQFAGFSADLGRFNGTWLDKAGIRLPLGNSAHDLSPNILMEACTAII